MPQDPLPDDRARAKGVSNDFALAYAAVADRLRAELGDALAAEAGPPVSIKLAPRTAELTAKQWNEPHPEATDQAMWALAQQKYAEHLQAGMDDATARRATAEDLTHFRYRGRLPLYTDGTTSWQEQVRNAEQMAKEASRLAEGMLPSPNKAAEETGTPASAQPLTSPLAAPSPETPPGPGPAPLTPAPAPNTSQVAQPGGY